MAKYEFTPRVAASGGSYVDLDNVTSVVASRGRRQPTDPYRTQTCVITGRLPASLPTILIGDKLSINVNVFTPPPLVAPYSVFYGRVTNFRIIYGKTANEDLWEITGEGAMAEAGRRYVSGSWSAGTAFGTAATFFNTVDFTVSASGEALISAQSFTNENLFEILTTLNNTEQGTMYEAGPDTVIIQSRNSPFNKNGFLQLTFTDGSLTAPSPNTNYDVIDFTGFADSYATKVVVQPIGLAAQTAGTGGRVYSTTTWDNTTTQAANLAEYLLSVLSVTGANPATLSCFSETQTNNEAIIAALEADRGGLVGIILRSVQHYAFILGSTITGTPESTRITFNLAAFDAYDFFRLDSDILGVLDENKLGY